MCDADSVHIWLIDGAVRAIVSVKPIRSVKLVAVYLSTHLAVADSLCREGDRAAASVHRLAAHLPPSSSDWLQSSGAALAGRHLTDHHPASRLTWRNAGCTVHLELLVVFFQPVQAGAALAQHCCNLFAGGCGAAGDVSHVQLTHQAGQLLTAVGVPAQVVADIICVG